MKMSPQTTKLLVLFLLIYLGMNLSLAQVKSPITVNGNNPPDGVKISKVERGNKKYELKNHLHNSLVVISDRKLQDSSMLGLVVNYSADVFVSTDYYAYGMQMVDREQSRKDYRYGFNGMEKDDEIKGNGNSLDFGARIYDPRLGRWLSVDPFETKYPEHTPYGFAMSNPVYIIDPAGDTVTVHVTKEVIGTTKINLFSSGEVKDTKDKAGKVIKKGVKQQTKTVNVYKVTVTNESGSTATFYFTRIAYRGNKDKPKEDPKEVTFDPSKDGEVFLGKIRSRWSKTDNVLEVTPTSGKRADGYSSYKGREDGRKLETRKYIQLHIKGASDGCLLAVGSGQFESTETGKTVDKTNLSSNSGGTQTKFMNKIKEFQKADKKAKHSDVIIFKFDQLGTKPKATTTTTTPATTTPPADPKPKPVKN